jgi:hypothetical protein
MADVGAEKPMLKATGGGEVVGSTEQAFCAVNPHCLENIVRLSDDMEVIASSDILDDRGVKLWAKGAPVSRALQEKMLLRRLKKPLKSVWTLKAPRWKASSAIVLHS